MLLCALPYRQVQGGSLVEVSITVAFPLTTPASLSGASLDVVSAEAGAAFFSGLASVDVAGMHVPMDASAMLTASRNSSSPSKATIPIGAFALPVMMGPANVRLDDAQRFRRHDLT